MKTINDIPRYAIIVSPGKVEHIELTEEQRQDLWAEWKDDPLWDFQEMADYLDLGTAYSSDFLYVEKPEGWPTD